MRLKIAEVHVMLLLALAAVSGCCGFIESPAGNEGRLAYVGGDGNVYVTTPDRRQSEQITTDATAPPEGQGLSYHRLSWSLDGSLAFAAVTRSENQARSTLYVKESSREPARAVARNSDHFIIYVYWAPVSCLDQAACHLAYLVEEEDGVGLHLVTMEAEATDDQLVAVGRPFYFSWSPDGQQILWHTGGARRNNPDAQIGLRAIEQVASRALPYTPGSFSAPAWSPQGEQWLAVLTANGVDRLQRIGPGDPLALADTTASEIAFVWSPEGRRIAYAVRAAGAPFYGPVQLFDLQTRETRRLTGEAFNILGFFWAPDGQRLAYLTRLDLPDAVWMQWRVFNLSQDQDRGFAAFHPSPLMRFIVHSFSQYAQSHRFWSPDGRYLVYSDRDRESVDRVWLIDTQAQKGAAPILVDKGSIGVWSWR